MNDLEYNRKTKDERGDIKNSMRRYNIIGTSKDNRENEREVLKKIMIEKFPVLMKDTSPQL